MSVITVFDHFGVPLTEIEAVTRRSWMLLDSVRKQPGRCEFSVSTKEAKCKERYLRYGNLVLVQHVPSTDEDGSTRGTLPDWVGMIQIPRTWPFGSVGVTAYSAEIVLMKRCPPFKTFYNTAWEGIVADFLDYANAETKNGLTVRKGFLQPSAGQMTYWDVYTDIFAHLANIGEPSVRAEYSHGKMTLYMDWWNGGQRGIACPIVLDETNTESAEGQSTLTEQGTLINASIFTNTTDTLFARTERMWRNERSISKYGLMEGYGVIQGGNSVTPAQLLSAAQSMAEGSGEPIKTIQPVVLDKGQLLSYMSPGNRFPLSISNVGFLADGLGIEGWARMVGVEYSDDTRRCRTVMEELV